jgi:hypothetical protein
MELPGVMAPSRRVEEVDGGFIIHVKPPAFVGGPEVSVLLTADQYERYQQWRERKGLIDQLLYDLNDSQREMLMSGLTDEAFTRIAGTGED